MFLNPHNKFGWKGTRYYVERCQVFREQVHSQQLSSFKFITLEGVVLEHFKILKPSTIPMVKFKSHLSDKTDQYASTTATHLCIHLKFFLQKG